MTENEKKESKQAEEPSESTVAVSTNNAGSNSDNSSNSDPSPAVSEKAEERTPEEATPELSVAPTFIASAADDEKPVGTGSSCCNNHGEKQEPQRQVPLYVGLSILFILLLFYYNLTKSKDQAKKITQIGNSVSAIGSQIGGLDLQISGLEKSLTKYEQSILSLELKKSLVTVEEIIAKSNDKTLDVAIRAKSALRSLIDSIAPSSAGSKYRVKQISRVKERELPTLSVIKEETRKAAIANPEKRS